MENSQKFLHWAKGLFSNFLPSLKDLFMRHTNACEFESSILAAVFVLMSA